jgi:hypothetical protein
MSQGWESVDNQLNHPHAVAGAVLILLVGEAHLQNMLTGLQIGRDSFKTAVKPYG